MRALHKIQKEQEQRNKAVQNWQTRYLCMRWTHGNEVIKHLRTVVASSVSECHPSWSWDYHFLAICAVLLAEVYCEHALHSGHSSACCTRPVASAVVVTFPFRCKVFVRWVGFFVFLFFVFHYLSSFSFLFSFFFYGNIDLGNSLWWFARRKKSLQLLYSWLRTSERMNRTSQLTGIVQFSTDIMLMSGIFHWHYFNVRISRTFSGDGFILLVVVSLFLCLFVL